MSIGPMRVGWGRFSVHSDVIQFFHRKPDPDIFPEAGTVIVPLYTLPPDLRRAWVPSLRQKLIWGLMGAALMGLACLAAYGIGGAL